MFKSAELNDVQTGAAIGGAGGAGLGIIRQILGDNKVLAEAAADNKDWFSRAAERERAAFAKLKDAVLQQRAWDKAVADFEKLPQAVQESGAMISVPYQKPEVLQKALEDFKYRRKNKLHVIKENAEIISRLKKGRLGNTLIAGGTLGGLGLLGGAGIGKLTSLLSEKNASFKKQALSPAYLEEMAGLAKDLGKHKQSIHLAAGAKGRRLGTAITNAGANTQALLELIPGLRLRDAETISKYLYNRSYTRGITPTTLGEMLNGPVSSEVRKMRRNYSGTDRMFEHIGNGFLSTFKPPAIKAAPFSL